MAQEKRDFGITLIAIGKLLKTVVLIGLGIAFFEVSTHDARHLVGEWADYFRIDPHNRWLDRGLAKLSGHNPHQLFEMGIGTFVYAALFAIEGTGLWLKKRWAEWLTIAITTSFIPLEVYEIAKEPSAGKIVALVLNVAAVIYLLARRIKSITSSGHGTPKTALTSS